MAIKDSAPTAEMFNQMLEVTIDRAHECGVKEERARIAAIMNLSAALSLPRLAWRLAEGGQFTREQVDKALAIAMSETVGPAGDEAPAGVTLN